MPFAFPRIWWGISAASAALLIAVSAALIVAPDGHFAFGIESASSAATGLIQRPGATLPRIYALFAGMVAAFNPCGFALLPAYLGLYLQGGGRGDRSLTAMVLTPLQLSLAVTAAFVAAFGLVGLAVAAVGAAVSSLFPWIGLSVGVLLIVAGGASLSGWALNSGGAAIASRLGIVASRANLSGYFAYGIAYALASLGCTLPVFLTVVGSALLARGWVGEVGQFVLYGVGMAAVLAAITIAAAIFRTQLLVRLRGVSRIVEPLSAMLLLIVGAYLVYYWLTLGGLLLAAS